VNGISNADVFASNQKAVEPPIDMSLPAVESQPADDISSTLNSSQLPDTNTTATTEEPQPSTIPDTQEPPTSSLLASADSAIDTAIEDVAAPSTVPPVVEAQESDLRHTSSPLVQPAQPEEQPSSMEFDFGTGAELPQGDNIVDRTADADVPDLSFSENIPELPDLSTNDQALQQPSEDFGATDPLKLEPDSNAIPEHADVDMSGLDNIMADTTAPDPAPADESMQPPKIAREREDDDESEPSAKRTKTEEADLDQEMADVPSAPASNGEPAAATAGTGPPTEYQVKELVKIIKNVARTKDGKNFRAPVAELWPTIAEGYLQKITSPMDLLTVEQKLKDGAYPSLDALKDDVRLIVTNTTIFNGPDHLVTVAARGVRDSLLNKFENLPVEPAPVIKKEKKIKTEAPARATAARRPSRGASTTAVQPPSQAAAAPAPQTFALDPSTQMPLIRRDSTKVEGGRPKREIHPPKNKDLPYSLSRPKNKKFATELKFCEHVLKELNDSKYKDIAHPFYVPVDPVALGIPGYFAVIKSPMDLLTAGNKLKEGQYATAKDFEKDIRLIVANCLKFNPQGNAVRELGIQFERLFNEKWANKQNWIAQRSPAPASPAGTPDSDDEESDEEEEDEPEAPAGSSGMSMLAQRLIEEQSKLIAMMKDKKADKAMITLQQSLIDMIETQVKKEGEAQARPVAKKAKKPKAPKQKKPAPVKKAPAPKKSGGRQPSKYMGTLEKEVISAGIGQLPDDISATVLGWIKQEQPGVDVSWQGSDYSYALLTFNRSLMTEH
jgi:bromodomain-containing factor 1